jgi:hypothetical protein
MMAELLNRLASGFGALATLLFVCAVFSLFPKIAVSQEAGDPKGNCKGCNGGSCTSSKQCREAEESNTCELTCVFCLGSGVCSTAGE